MSFYITVKSAKLSTQHQNIKEKVSIVITSATNRLIGTFTIANQHSIWEDAFVASTNQRQLQFMLIQQKIPGKSGLKLCSNIVNMSKYLFSSKNQIDQIPLLETGQTRDILILQIIYVERNNFIGQIQFFKKGNSSEFQQDEVLDIKIEGDDSLFPFWKKGKTSGRDQGKGTHILDLINERENVQFYKGPHKNRNIFSLCDKVYDDQKFTVVQNYYDNQ